MYVCVFEREREIKSERKKQRVKQREREREIDEKSEYDVLKRAFEGDKRYK